MAVIHRTGLLVLLLFAASGVWCPAALAEDVTDEELVGTEFPEFALPSTQDRLVTYAGDYYGKHHLILTFFPAAFTPI